MFTSSDRTADGDAFVIGSPGFDNQREDAHRQEAYHDPLEDVFGSAPSSPVRAHDEADSRTTPEIRHSTAEPSDVPRLRSIHVTNGYREGIAAGKEQSVQAGFDEGYALGAEYGSIAGWIKGVLEGLISTSADDHQRADLDQLMQQVKQELDMSNLFSAAYFGSDGIWTYDVPEALSESTTFREVASAHPVLVKWRGIITNTIARQGLTLQ